MKTSRLVAAIALVGAAAIGCHKETTCTAEVTQGDGTFTGKATVAEGSGSAEHEAVRDACRQLCAASKAQLVDGCVAKCATDADLGKIGKKASCK